VRFWIDCLAGDSQIDQDLGITEADTSKVTAQSHLNLLAGGMAGDWSVGATDRNLLDYVVATTKQYLEDNYVRGSSWKALPTNSCPQSHADETNQQPQISRRLSKEKRSGRKSQGFLSN
jgi:hypothetical protein